MSGLDEIGGSIVETIDEGSGTTVERKFLIPWEGRIDFAAELIAASTAYPGPLMSRIAKIQMQPWNEDLVPVGTVISAAEDIISYGSQPCLITVNYAPDFTRKEWPSDFPKPDYRVGTELRYQIRGSAKFLLVPSSATKWESDEDAPVPEDVNSAILIPMRAIQLQWDFVDDPPITDLESLQGRVNSDSFLGCEPETILFENYDISETFRASVEPHTNRVTVNLTVRRVDTGSGIVGWNHDYRTEPPGWDRLLLADGQPRYQSTAFAEMFT